MQLGCLTTGKPYFLSSPTHCCINWGEETACGRKNNGSMPEFVNKGLEGLQQNQFAAEKTMSCFDKCCRFGRRQVDSTFDAIEGEPNHVLLACVVPIAQIQLLAGDGFLSILMTGYFRLGKKGMDPMNNCSTDYWEVSLVQRLRHGKTEIINIHLEELSWDCCPGARGHCLDFHYLL